MTAAQRDYRERQVAKRNREDLSVLLELRDIEDELSTILKLLDQQDTVIKSMIKYFDSRGYGKVFLDTAQGRIDEYRSQISEMKENSHLAQKAVSLIPAIDFPVPNTNSSGRNTPRSQTKTGKCRRSQNGPMAGRSYADPVARSNGLYNFLCRVSPLFHLEHRKESNKPRFLPLSFFTSLFGINAREWSGEATNLTLGQMLKIAGMHYFKPKSIPILT
jgi:hypothetical protein